MRGVWVCESGSLEIPSRRRSDEPRCRSLDRDAPPALPFLRSIDSTGRDAMSRRRVASSTRQERISREVHSEAGQAKATALSPRFTRRTRSSSFSASPRCRIIREANVCLRRSGLSKEKAGQWKTSPDARLRYGNFSTETRLDHTQSKGETTKKTKTSQKAARRAKRKICSPISARHRHRPTGREYCPWRRRTESRDGVIGNLN